MGKGDNTSDTASITSRTSDDHSGSSLLDSVADYGTRSLRVARVLGQGVICGVGDGAREGWDDKGGTGVKLAWSLGVGYVLGTAERGSTLFKFGAGAAGLGFAGAFAYDTARHGESIID